MRSMKPASSAAGRPWKSCRPSGSSSIRSISMARRSAGATAVTNGSRPAAIASSRSRRVQKPAAVETVSVS